jgi:hypothetical protein
MRRIAMALLAAALTYSVGTHASCGAAFCTVNTDWSSQGAMTDPGVRFDLRYEFIDLDQPRSGTDRIGVGAIPRHHDEVETRNHNWVANAEWVASPRWAVSLALPYVDREHLHIHNHRGAQLPERWDFRGLGDARLQARYAFGTETSADSMAFRTWGLTFGAKLPTGKHDVANAEGALAERTLQPGTGTTDALLGVYWHGATAQGWSWFARAQAVLPMNERDGYKPGRQLQLDGGARYGASRSFAWLVQVNASWRGRDSGVEAEPEDSGQRALHVSPGVSWSLGRDAQLYAFVQVPLYQRVNGVQLTADWSALAGVSFRF